MVLLKRQTTPIAVLSSPVVFAASALTPSAVLFPPLYCLGVHQHR